MSDAGETVSVPADIFAVDGSGADVVVFERLYPDVRLPNRATEHSAGYDVCAYLTGTKTRFSSGLQIFERGPDESEGVPFISLMPGQRAIVPLGFKARVPQGIEAQIRIRSSIAFRKGLTMPNAPGTIDADYRGELKVILQNGGAEPFPIRRGDRIAQLVFARHETPELRESEGVSETARGAGGFGSTGR